ncbi:MAG: hypothetical protein ACERK6_05000 [Candidatus Aminicenantaceae bacterium]
MVKLFRKNDVAGAPADAIDIVSAYHDVLKDREKFGVGAPQSMLPYEKSEIKSAFKAVMLEAKDPEEREKLKKGYITLADFVPDATAERVNQNWQEVADAQCETDQNLGGASETDVMAEVVRIQKGIADEGAWLTQEIETFIADLTGE